MVLVGVAVLTAHLLFSPNNFSNATLGHAHLTLYIVVVTFYFLFTLDCYNFSTSHRPIGVKITSQAAQTSPMSEFTLLCTPNVKAGDLETPDYLFIPGPGSQKYFPHAQVHSWLR